jgi:hypothetical protein
MVIEFNATCLCAASISKSTAHERRIVAEFDFACLRTARRSRLGRPPVAIQSMMVWRGHRTAAPILTGGGMAPRSRSRATWRVETPSMAATARMSRSAAAVSRGGVIRVVTGGSPSVRQSLRLSLGIQHNTGQPLTNKGATRIAWQ